VVSGRVFVSPGRVISHDAEIKTPQATTVRHV